MLFRRNRHKWQTPYLENVYTSYLCIAHEKSVWNESSVAQKKNKYMMQSIAWLGSSCRFPPFSDTDRTSLLVRDLSQYQILMKMKSVTFAIACIPYGIILYGLSNTVLTFEDSSLHKQKKTKSLWKKIDRLNQFKINLLFASSNENNGTFKNYGPSIWGSSI